MQWRGNSSVRHCRSYLFLFSLVHFHKQYHSLPLKFTYLEIVLMFFCTLLEVSSEILNAVFFSLISNSLNVSTYHTQQKMKVRERDQLWYIERSLGQLSVCSPFFWSISKGNGLSGLVHVKLWSALFLTNRSHMHLRLVTFTNFLLLMY